MDYQDATDFVETFKTHRTGLVGYQLSQRQVEERNEKLALVKGLLWRGERYEKICRALVERYGYAYVHKLVDKSAAEVSQVREIMEKLRVEFFGTRPKTRGEKFDDAIEKVYELEVRERATLVDVVNLLIGLRDSREENV